MCFTYCAVAAAAHLEDFITEVPKAVLKLKEEAELSLLAAAATIAKPKNKGLCLRVPTVGSAPEDYCTVRLQTEALEILFQSRIPKDNSMAKPGILCRNRIP
ncbi:hypothetical protein BY996DRAFT_6412478 [Phakopsora pachyrhizi]|nr:hypothetical protein BY996DRAFT_6412478 [Phakopsora pachyrhizi]